MTLKECHLERVSMEDMSAIRFLSHYPIERRVGGLRLAFFVRPVEEAFAKLTRAKQSVFGEHTSVTNCAIPPRGFNVLYATCLSFMILYCGMPEVVTLIRIMLSCIPTCFQIIPSELEHDVRWRLDWVDFSDITPGPRRITQICTGVDLSDFKHARNLPCCGKAGRWLALAGQIQKCRAWIRRNPAFADCEFANYMDDNYWHSLDDGMGPPSPPSFVPPQPGHRTNYEA